MGAEETGDLGTRSLEALLVFPDVKQHVILSHYFQSGAILLKIKTGLRTQTYLRPWVEASDYPDLEEGAR